MIYSVRKDLMNVSLSGGNDILYSNKNRFSFDDQTMYFEAQVSVYMGNSSWW